MADNERQTNKIDIDTYTELVNQCIEAGDADEIELDEQHQYSKSTEPAVAESFRSRSLQVLTLAVIAAQLVAGACYLVLRMQAPKVVTLTEAQKQLVTRLGPDMQYLSYANSMIEAASQTKDARSQQFINAVNDYNRTIKAALDHDSSGANDVQREAFSLDFFISNSAGVEYADTSNNPH